MSKTFYGLYRGTVENNIDPMGLGRIVALVPDIGGKAPLGWAMPCSGPRNWLATNPFRWCWRTT